MQRPRSWHWVFALFLLPIAALACPPHQYQQCVLGACICVPEVGGTVGQVAEKTKTEVNGETEGPVLAAWLQASRNSAYGSANPIPPNIRQMLTGYIEDDVMNRARYKVGDNGILNLAGLTLQYGDKFVGTDATAVTVIDVVVFRDAGDAANNASLWAHELTHVQQFRDWGVLNFAKRYVKDANGVEAQAYGVGNGFAAWRAARPMVVGSTGGSPTSLAPTYGGSIGGGLPSGFGMQTCGCWGPTAGVAPETKCASGSVRANMCAGMCPGGGSPYAWLCQ